MPIYCPKCIRETGYRVKGHPMDASCPECGTDFTQADTSFAHKMNDWIIERVEAGDITQFKGKLLLQLASQFVRSASMIDLWPKKPTHCNFVVHDETTFHISAGEVYKLGDDGAAISLIEDVPTLFPYRAGMDDPYVRVIIREDVPILELNRLIEKLVQFLSKLLEEEPSLFTRDEPDESAEQSIVDQISQIPDSYES